MNYKRIISLMLSVLICLSSIDFSYANHFSSRPNIQIGNNVAQQTVSEQPNISEIKKDVSLPSDMNKDDNKRSNNNSKENKPGKESQKQTDDSSSVNGTTKNDSRQDKDNKKQDTDKKEKDSSSEKGDLLNSATPNLNDIIQEQIKNNLSIALGNNPNTNVLSTDDSWKEQFKIEAVSGKSEIEIVPNAYQNEYFENLTIQVKMNEQLYQYFKGDITLQNNEEILYYTFLGYGLAKSFRGNGYHESPSDRMFINQDFTDILKEKIQNGDFIKTGEEYLLDLSSRSKLTAFSMREKEYELESWLDPKNKEERYKDYSFSDSKIKIPVTFKKGSYTSEQLQLLENQITLQSAETEVLFGSETHFTVRGEIGREVQDVFFPNSNLKINYSIVVNGEKRPLVDLIEIDKIDRYYMTPGMEPIIPRSADVVALNLNRDIASSHNNFLPGNLVYEGILSAGDYEILMEITEEDDATPLVTKKVSVSVKSFKEEKNETLNHLKSGEVFKFIFPSKDSVIQPADSKNRPIRIEMENTKQMVESIWERQLQPLTEVFIKNTNDKIVVKGKLKKVERGIYTIEGDDSSDPLSYAISFLKEGNYTIEVNYSDDTTGLIQEIVPFVVMDKNSKYIQAIKEKINGEIISYENKYRNLRFKLDKETYQLMIKPTKKFDRMTWLDYRIDIYNEEGNLAHSTRNLKSEIRKSALQGNQEEYFDSIALKESIYNSNPLLKDGKYKAEIVFLYDPYYKSEFVTIGKSKPFEFEINEGQDKFTEDEALKNKILEITAAFTPSITQTHDETKDIYGDIILNDAGIESINQELQKLKAEFTNIYNIYLQRQVNIFDENGKSVAFTQSGDGVITLTNPIRFATPTKYKMVAQYFVKINISGKEEQKLTISNLKQDVFVNAIHKQSMSAELEELKKTAEIKIHSSEVRGFEFTAGHKINEPLYQYLQSNSAVFKINYRLQDEDGHSLFLKENYYNKRSYYRFPNASDRLYNCQTEYIEHSLNLKPGTYQIKATLFVQDKENKAYYPIAENMVTQYYSGSNSNEDLFDTLRDKEFKLIPLDKETYDDIDDIEFTTSIDKEVYTKNIKKVIFSNEILVVKLKIGYHYGQVIADKKVEEIHYDSKN